MIKDIFLKSLLFIICVVILYYLVKYNKPNNETFDTKLPKSGTEIDTTMNKNLNNANTTKNNNVPNNTTNNVPNNTTNNVLNNITSNANVSLEETVTEKCSLGTSSLDLSVIGDQIMNLYWELLQRQPTSQELSSSINEIKNGTLTIEGLRRRLVDSDEYDRLSKLQSNELNPELKKMLSDRELITYIAKIYKDEKQTIIPNYMTLPLKDIYNYLNYNDYAFRAMLRDSSYPKFDNSIKTGFNLTRTNVIDIFLEYFSVDYLVKMGIEIFGNDPTNANVACSIDTTTNMKVNANANANKTSGSGSGGSGGNGVNSGVGKTIAAINNNPTLFNKDAAAKSGLGASGQVVPFSDNTPYSMTQTDMSVQLIKNIKDITSNPDSSKTIPIHKHDMVLIPELAWSVPQEFPPVCTTLGQPSLAQPVFTNSSLLNGTPLGEAANTHVGSVMPRYDQVSASQLKEYITIPN